MSSSVSRFTDVARTLPHGKHFLPNRTVTNVKVARNMEELMQAFVVRAAVFMSEESFSYADEFDGNDFTATQILGLVGDEPAATIRIRYFAGFAKPERLAVRREFRKSGVAADVVEFAVELCRKKGYSKLYGHAEERLVPFWERFGFTRMGRPDFLSFDQNRYVEIERDLEPLPGAMSIAEDPVALIHPEGDWPDRDWDRRGMPDQITERLAAQPAGE